MKRLILCFCALLFVSPLVSLAQIVGGVALEYDPATVFTIEAGTRLQFDLVARDTPSHIIDNWSTVGQDAVLSVRGTVAETDTSRRSWSADPRSYSWLELRLNGFELTLDSIGQDQGLYYTLPPSAFTLGRATLDFTLTCAGKDITLTVTPTFGTLTQKSPPITIVPSDHVNYLVEVTWPKPGMKQVFLLRRYEIVVTPRDRYLNPIIGSPILTAFTAAFPFEFVQGRDGVPAIFAGPVNITGPTNLMVMSNIRRMDKYSEARQRVMAYSNTNPMISGVTDPFEIIDHAPNAFALRQPLDRRQISLQNANDEQKFTWIKSLPQDPYSDIQISRFNPQTFSDTVKYKVTFVDEATLTRAMDFEADSGGIAASLTLTHGRLSHVVDQLSGKPDTKEFVLVWYVTAFDYSDGAGPLNGPMYSIESSPPNLDPQSRPGYRLYITDHLTNVHAGVNPSEFTLRQNYPNPFASTTSIAVDLPSAAHCRLVVYNLLGEEIALLHDGRLDSGSHSFEFNAAGLPPGLYAYRAFINGEAQTRSMLLLR